MPLIPIAMALAQFAPMIAGWLGGAKAEDVATKVVGIAQQVTGAPSPDAAAVQIQGDPALQEKFQEAVLAEHLQIAQMAHDETMAEIALEGKAMDATVQNMAAVNATMQAEDHSDHWPTYTWRPFVGFVFGAALLISVLVVAVAYIGVIFKLSPPDVLSQLPAFITSMGVLLAVPLPILGVASYFRGKMQADPGVKSDNRG